MTKSSAELNMQISVFSMQLPPSPKYLVFTKKSIPPYLHGDDWLEVLVQLVHERDARGEVEAHNVLVGDPVQVLHDAAQRVAMRRDQDPLASFHLKHSSCSMYKVIHHFIRSWERFCKMLCESSPCLLGQHYSCCTPFRQKARMW